MRTTMLSIAPRPVTPRGRTAPLSEVTDHT
jgi:hypothetical protein